MRFLDDREEHIGDVEARILFLAGRVGVVPPAVDGAAELLDGRRVGLIGASGAVDVNMIPSNIIAAMAALVLPETMA